MEQITVNNSCISHPSINLVDDDTSVYLNEIKLMQDPMEGDITPVDHSQVASPVSIPLAHMKFAYEKDIHIQEKELKRLKRCIVSENGNIYCPIRTLRSCIYGKIKHCVKIVQTDEVFTFGETFAMKCIEKDKIKMYSGVHHEDPIKELSLMWFLSFERGGHQNVISIIDILETDTHICAIMPFCSGGELFNLVSNSKKTELNKVRNLFHQIIEGVDFLHRNLITHRDLSLENILISNSEENSIAVLIDLGLALRIPRIEKSPILLDPCGSFGKLYYMAPEIYRNESFDGFAIDIWACGIILFILLNGVPPFEQPNEVDLRFKKMIKEAKMNEVLDSWGQLEHSPNARDLLNQMLNINPMNRPTTSQVLNHPWLQGND